MEETSEALLQLVLTRADITGLRVLPIAVTHTHELNYLNIAGIKDKKWSSAAERITSE